MSGSQHCYCGRDLPCPKHGDMRIDPPSHGDWAARLARDLVDCREYPDNETVIPWFLALEARIAAALRTEREAAELRGMERMREACAKEADNHECDDGGGCMAATYIRSLALPTAAKQETQTE